MAFGANATGSGPTGSRSGPNGASSAPIGRQLQRPGFASYPAANASRYGYDWPFFIRGVSRDSTGSALANCEIYLFDVNRTLVQQTVSDGSGNYSFQVSGKSSYYQVHFYLVGSPDRAGITKNTLQGAYP